MMNKIIYITVILPFILTGCNQFLEHADKDLLIPETVEQYRQLLIGEAYPDDFQGNAD